MNQTTKKRVKKAAQQRNTQEASTTTHNSTTTSKPSTPARSTTQNRAKHTTPANSTTEAQWPNTPTTSAPHQSPNASQNPSKPSTNFYTTPISRKRPAILKFSQIVWGLTWRRKSWWIIRSMLGRSLNLLRPSIRRRSRRWVDPWRSWLGRLWGWFRIRLMRRGWKVRWMSRRLQFWSMRPRRGWILSRLTSRPRTSRNSSASILSTTKTRQTYQRPRSSTLTITTIYREITTRSQRRRNVQAIFPWTSTQCSKA